MTSTLNIAINIALAQLNVVVGDLDGNAKKIMAAHAAAAAQGADLVITPELSISGYPPEDLVLRPAYVAACMKKTEALALALKDGPPLIVGLPWKNETIQSGKPYNAAALLRDGKIEQLWFKYDLPNYCVFDDKRVFTAAGEHDGEPFLLKGARIGVAICEDIWTKNKAASLKNRGAEILIALNASPYEHDKFALRHKVVKDRTVETGLPVIFINQLGGQDEIVFDGSSFVMNSAGEITAHVGAYEERLAITRWEKKKNAWVPLPQDKAPFMNEEELIYTTLITGLRDYVEKNNFPGILLGMSGGIDSALVAALAVDALGPQRVITVMMPSPYTSKESLEDAQKASQALGCTYKIIPIENAMTVMGQGLKAHVAGYNTDIAEQNVQSRLRGIILMALSNVYGHMVVATGNKSEMATGYATLYGDMCGGYAAIKDVYKTFVYRLCKWRNLNRPKNGLGPAGFVMPERIITRAPTAELKPGQLDQDSLPPYDVLDGILQCLIEGELSIEETKARGYEEATVRKVLRMLKNAEYKRRQAPPGCKITSRSFGRERRYPLTSRFYD